MLRKLMKYEFMATSRVFLPLFAALIILSAVNKLLSFLPMAAPQVIGTVVSVILMIGIIVLTLILTLQRFRNNLLSNEGHLMMTLPVSTDRIILSKMFVAAIWSVASVIVVFLSIMIMAITEINFSDLGRVLRPVRELIAAYPMQTIVYIIEAVIAIALSLFSGILLLYACMALSMLVNKRRGLFTFGAFIVITTAMQTVFAILIAVVAALGLNDLLNIVDLGIFGQSQVAIAAWMGCEAALFVAFYFTTRHMLKKRLNLQ